MLQSDRRKHLDRTIALGAAFTDTSNLARRDVLTGLGNRLAFEETVARFELIDAPIGVVLADVDGLKAANDTHGHDAGDRLIIAVAHVLSGALAAASGAVAFRTGGDEFAVFLPCATPAATEELASVVRAGFAGAPPVDDAVPVSASVGVGHAAAGPVLGNAIATADRAVNHDKDRRGLRRR